MDLEQLKQLLDLVREHEIAEFEIEHEGLRVKIRKDANGTPVVGLPAIPGGSVAVGPSGAPAPTAATAQAATGPTLAADATAESDAEIELAAREDDAEGHLSAIRDQDFLEHRYSGGPYPPDALRGDPNAPLRYLVLIANSRSAYCTGCPFST